MAGKCELAARMTVVSLYRRTWRTYFAWARMLLPLAAIVFVPLGLLSAIPLDIELDSLSLGSGVLAVAVLVAALALIGTSLVGEVFYSGVVAVSLTYDGEGRPPTLAEIARRLRYGNLIAVDLIYGLFVVVGLFLLVVPGVAAYIWLSLAGPVVEIERRGVREAFARSARLVRGRFWLVFAVLAPLELASETFGELTAQAAEELLGHGIWAEWIGEALANVLATPFLAIACVLLTVGLIGEKEGVGPPLHSHPPRP